MSTSDISINSNVKSFYRNVMNVVMPRRRGYNKQIQFQTIYSYTVETMVHLVIDRDGYSNSRLADLIFDLERMIWSETFSWYSIEGAVKKFQSEIFDLPEFIWKSFLINKSEQYLKKNEPIQDDEDLDDMFF